MRGQHTSPGASPVRAGQLHVRPHAAPTDHMRKSLVLRAVALLGVLLLSFVAGVVGGAWRGWLQLVATVTIVNQTGQQIEKLSVAHRTKPPVQPEQSHWLHSLLASEALLGSICLAKGATPSQRC